MNPPFRGFPSEIGWVAPVRNLDTAALGSFDAGFGTQEVSVNRYPAISFDPSGEGSEDWSQGSEDSRQSSGGWKLPPGG